MSNVSSIHSVINYTRIRERVLLSIQQYKNKITDVGVKMRNCITCVLEQHSDVF